MTAGPLAYHGGVIDRASRDRLAELLRSFAGGEISADVFRSEAPRSADRAIREILGQAWVLAEERKSGEESRVRGEDRGEVIRWVLFLQTELEYEWPSLPAWARLAGFIPSMLTFGLFWMPYRRWFERRGEFRVWPFIREIDYRAARAAKPRRPLLSPAAR